MSCLQSYSRIVGVAAMGAWRGLGERHTSRLGLGLVESLRTAAVETRVWRQPMKEPHLRRPGLLVRQGDLRLHRALSGRPVH